MVRPDRFEPHGQQVVRGQHARDAVPAQVAERLDCLDSAPGQVLGDALDQHPAQPAALEFGENAGRHQQDRITADRAGRKGDRSGHIQRRGIEDITGRYAVHIGNFSAAAPFEKHGGNPRLLFQRGIADLLRAGVANRVQFPEDTLAALMRQVVQIVKRDVSEAARHRHPFV